MSSDTVQVWRGAVSGNTWRSVAAWVVFATLLVWLMPKRVIVRGDDFGYLESVALTIKSGALEQSDWLGPFNVPLPLVCAALYAVTHSFWFATHGLLIALGLLNFYLVRRWLATNEILDPLAALALVICPLWLNKAVEFTGVALGITVFLCALLAWRSGRRWMFFALMLIGVANRQSMVCLLFLPLVELIRHWWLARRLDWVLVLGGCTVAGTFVVLQSVYPATYARAGVSDALSASISLSVLTKNLGLGLIVLIGIRAILGWLKGESPVGNFRANLECPLWPMASFSAAAILIWSGAFVSIETPGLDRFSSLMTVTACFAGCWFGNWRDRPAVEVVGCVGFYVVLVSLRGQWWDYYFLEPALLLAANTKGVVSGVVVSRYRTCVLLATLMAACAYAFWFRGYLSKIEARIVVYEQALRAGDLKMTELSEAPFGYLGWKLFDIAKNRADGGRLSDFLKYVEMRCSSFSGGVMYIFPHGLGRSIHPKGELWALPQNSRNRAFPLSDIEWSLFLESSRVDPVDRAGKG